MRGTSHDLILVLDEPVDDHGRSGISKYLFLGLGDKVQAWDEHLFKGERGP